ncbi:hypothetical protein [Polaromonas sp. UC242_47]
MFFTAIFHPQPSGVQRLSRETPACERRLERALVTTPFHPSGVNT